MFCKGACQTFLIDVSVAVGMCEWKPILQVVLPDVLDVPAGFVALSDVPAVRFAVWYLNMV